jgi:hypothetical protein
VSTAYDDDVVSIVHEAVRANWRIILPKNKS